MKIHKLARQATAFIDITEEVCPITFVRVKLALERLRSGDVLDVRLKSGEPLENVPASARELGYRLFGPWPEDKDESNGIFRLQIEKTGS